MIAKLYTFAAERFITHVPILEVFCILCESASPVHLFEHSDTTPEYMYERE